MDRISKWLIDIALTKEAEEELIRLLMERDRYFSPEDYSLEIIKHIPLENFDEEFTKIENLISHKKEKIPELISLQRKIETYFEEGKSYIRRQQDANKLNTYENLTCFIYFFTVTKEFDKTSPNYKNEKEQFLNNQNGVTAKKSWFKENEDGSIIEKLVYIGETTNLATRIIGHDMFRKLHDKRYKNSNKTLYLANITIDEYFHYKLISGEPKVEIIETPLEMIRPYDLVKNVLRYLESMLIAFFEIPEFNNRDTVPKLLFTKENDENEEIIEDLWTKIPFPSNIRLSEYKNSLFFGDPHRIDKKKRNELFNNIPEKEKEKIKKKAEKLGLKID